MGFVWCERNWVAMFVCRLVGNSAVHPKKCIWPVVRVFSYKRIFFKEISLLISHLSKETTKCCVLL
jgi:hypothetical protein